MVERSQNPEPWRDVAPAKQQLAGRAEMSLMQKTNQQNIDELNIHHSVMQAAVEAGGGSLVAYLRQQAEEHPNAFLSLLGKVLSMQKAGAKKEPEHHEFTVRFVGNGRSSHASQRGDAETNKKTLA